MQEMAPIYELIAQGGAACVITCVTKLAGALSVILSSSRISWSRIRRAVLLIGNNDTGCLTPPRSRFYLITRIVCTNTDE